jgi:type VI secretion system secreted protein VgrG
VQPGAFVHDDFDFKKPSAGLRTMATIARDHAQSQFEVCDYPGEYVAIGEGDRYARVSIERHHDERLEDPAELAERDEGSR